MSRSRRAAVRARLWHRAAPGLVTLLLAACQPQARRALLLDLSLSDPVLIASTATPWTEAGYVVEYRRFYPHLTREDLTRYHTIILLGGRQPEAWSDALDAGDLALLTAWVPHGGVLVFGYVGAGEGSFDRRVMNRWLRGIGAGITITEAALADQPEGPGGPLSDLVRARGASTELDLATPRDFPTGHLHALRVTYPSQALAVAPASAVARAGDSTVARGGVPVAAARRVDRGLVVVTSRHFLGAGGAELHATPAVAFVRDSFAVTRRFFGALARWTRRPAAWARVPERGPTAPIVAVALAPRAPPLRSPAALGVLRFPRTPPPDTRVAAPRPDWAARDGIRGVWTRAPLTAPGLLDSLLPFLDGAGLNVLASPFPRAAPPDSANRSPGAATLWTQALSRLATTSVLWFPIISVDPRAVAPTTCWLDDTLWSGTVDPALHDVVRLAPTLGAPIGGVVLELPGSGAGPPAELCDASARAGLTQLGWDSTAIARFLTLEPSARYDALLRAGTLGLYVAALETATAARARRSATVLRRSAPGLVVALWSRPTATDWRVLGLARGFGTDSTPVLLWDEELYATPIVTAFRQRGVTAFHTLTLPAAVLGEPGLARLRTPVFGDSDGFWVGPIGALGTRAGWPMDSVARRLRRLARGE